jgi:hypothetical protein
MRMIGNKSADLASKDQAFFVSHSLSPFNVPPYTVLEFFGDPINKDVVQGFPERGCVHAQVS